MNEPVIIECSFYWIYCSAGNTKEVSCQSGNWLILMVLAYREREGVAGNPDGVSGFPDEKHYQKSPEAC